MSSRRVVTENRNLAALADRWSDQHRKIAIWVGSGVCLPCSRSGAPRSLVPARGCRRGTRIPRELQGFRPRRHHAETVDLPGVGLLQPKPGLLHGVFGLAERTQNPIGHRAQLRAVAVEPVGELEFVHRCHTFLLSRVIGKDPPSKPMFSQATHIDPRTTPKCDRRRPMARIDGVHQADAGLKVSSSTGLDQG